MSGPGLGAAGAGLETGIAALVRRQVDPIAATADATPSGTDDETARLVGDVLFEVASVARRLGIDPELALRSRALALRDGVVAREKEGADLPIPTGTTH